MPDKTDAVGDKDSKPVWYRNLRKYEKPDIRKAVWQLLNTFVPYFLILYLMYRTIQSGYSYWITLALAVPAAGLLGRGFIFFHDCVHSSFFASRRANTILGYICGVLTFTPYGDWRRAHGLHHATVGDLDRRGIGDIWTLTVDEYRAAPRLTQIRYRIFRNPLVLFGLGPVYEFLIAHRFYHSGAGGMDRFSVHFNNLAILAIIAVAGVTIGLRNYVLIQLPVILLCGLMAVWVFYVQHQFEGMYWSRHEEWDPIRIAMKGCSYYKLPRVLQWFSGNIGYHHIHHLRPRIPNYNLQRCYEEMPEMRTVEPLTIRKSLKSAFLSLWDESRKKVVGFRSLKDIG
jgi:omega-6 fatty acid desaturase (delta-12 desaturase)